MKNTNPVVGYVKYTCKEEHKRAKEAYGDWSSNVYDYDFLGIDSSGSGRGISEQVAVKGGFEVGQTYYYVYVLYSAGDSFGWGTGNLCSIGVYKNKEDAYKTEAVIELDAKENPDYTGKTKIVDALGDEIYTGTWKGYFERFESCDVEALMFEG